MERTREYVSGAESRIRERVQNTPGLDFYGEKGRFIEDYTMELEGQKIRGKKIYLVSGARPKIPPVKGIEKIDGEWGVWPPFETKVLWEDEERVKRQEPNGSVVLVRKDATSLPHPLEWPVKDRASWQKLKDERLRLDISGRLPGNWSEHVALYKDRDWPLVIGGSVFGVFSSLRTLFGFQNLMYMFYDDPGLVHDVLDHLTELWLTLQ